MSPTERKILYRVFPFWGWYRTIGVISLRLPIESPIRLNFAQNLVAASQETGTGVPNFPLPSWLKGAVLIGSGGGGTQRVISTTGLNPFQTDVQVGESVAGDKAYGSSGPLSVLSPVGQALFAGAGYDPLYGGAYQGPAKDVGGWHGFALRSAAALGTGLPEYRLAQEEGVPGFPHHKSTLYKQSPLQYFLNYLGLPVKDVVPEEAARRAREGQ